MAYMLPLRYVLLSEKRSGDDQRCDFAVCATRIVGIMAMDSYQARETVKRERRAGTLINAAGREAVQSCVFLDNGSVIASPWPVKRIMRQIEKSNAKELRPSKASETRRLKVYEVVDEPPSPEDKEYLDASTDLDTPWSFVDADEFCEDAPDECIE